MGSAYSHIFHISEDTLTGTVYASQVINWATGKSGKMQNSIRTDTASEKGGEINNSKRYQIAYERLLNRAQLQAVTFGRGPLLVIAGAGSGKTRTLTYRVARLVEDGVDPKSILLLSFTRKASAEMLKRASELLDYRCHDVAGGTFHSFAYGILQRYASMIGFPQGFSIIDRGDAEDLIALARKDVATSGKGQLLPRKSTLATIFSRAINKGLTVDEVIYRDYPHFGPQLGSINEIQQVYIRQKRDHHFCDYDDLLVYMRQLLKNNEIIRNRLIDRFEYILVDEYQDTNAIQGDIVYLLAGDKRNVMVVGDDAQSIYAFRGANFKNIMSFPEQFPETVVIKLEENYRSLQPILDVTNALIEPAAEKYSKRLFSRREGGQTPLLLAAANENAQSLYIVEEILKLVKKGVSLKQIAVLFRASFHAFDLELELSRAGLSFVKVGGFKFTESAHIKDLLAYLKIIALPNDRISWLRILLLLDKIGPKAAQRIYEAVIKENIGASGLLKVKLTPAHSASVEGLRELIGAMDNHLLSVARMGEMALAYYLPYLKEHFDDHPRRLRDLEQLLAIMERYERLDDFLADMVLEPPNTMMQDRMAEMNHQADVLTLSTIHSAKGLEWDTVFIIWALDGRFPSYHSLDRPEEMEEERRLMYVAATRARERLYIAYPVDVYDRGSQSILYEPSRFIEDVPEHLLRRKFYNPF